MEAPPNPVLLRHLLDQLDATLADAAPVLINYHQTLVDGGMNPELVATLVRDVQTYMFRGVDF